MSLWNIITAPGEQPQVLPVGDPVPEGWTVEAQTANPDALSVATERLITKLKFRRRFTPAERVAMDSAPDNPALPAELRALARTMLIDLSVAEDINLDDPDVAQGIGLMVSIGILTAERAREILG